MASAEALKKSKLEVIASHGGVSAPPSLLRARVAWIDMASFSRDFRQAAREITDAPKEESLGQVLRGLERMQARQNTFTAPLVFDNHR